MKKAAAYIRVSTDRQTELSPESQLNEIRAFAKRNDMILLEDRIYRDDGISGTSIKRRNAFLDMIKDTDHSSWFYKLCQNYNRFYIQYLYIVFLA